MPTFCRHNRFIERCPICSKTLPDSAPARASAPRAKRSVHGGASAAAGRRPRARGEGVRIHRESRAVDDGYRSQLVPGLRASADASRLADEIAFSSGRLLALAARPPGLLERARAGAAADLERATWMCFLVVYLCPLEGPDPFAGISAVLAAVPRLEVVSAATDGRDMALADLDAAALGPRTSHDATRGVDTLVAYSQWVQRGGVASVAAPAAAAGAGAGGGQGAAFTGDATWSPQRRFERLFERLALPGLARMGRYDLLVTLGHLGLYELRPGSLQLAGARGLSAEDLTTMAAKRLFAIGDPLLLERRAAALAEAAAVPIEALDLAFANWHSPRRATLGFPPDTRDDGAFERVGDALGL